MGFTKNFSKKTQKSKKKKKASKSHFYRKSIWQINKHFVALKFDFKINQKKLSNTIKNEREKQNPQKRNI